LVLALIIVAYWGLNKFLKTPPAIITQLLKKMAVGLFLLVIVYFAATGRLNWLFALIGVFIAFMVRILPAFFRYVPQLHGLWRVFQQKNNSTQGINQKGKMTRQEAFDILGLNSPASEQQIILAHRKLMLKVHPDKGGSDFLAAQINQAKKVLLLK
jgi:hypothetical protein